jgi:hypothetical protein
VTWILAAVMGWYLHASLMHVRAIRHLRGQQGLAKINEWPSAVRNYETVITQRHQQLRWTSVVWLVATFALITELRTP